MARASNKQIDKLIADFARGKRDPRIVCATLSRDTLTRLNTKLAKLGGQVTRAARGKQRP